MKNDIFIDNNVAKNFKNPLDPHYKKLVEWLFEKGHLVLSQKLLKEYLSSNRGNWGQSILTIISRLTKDERLVFISNEQMENLRFTKVTERRLTCNAEDRWHLKTILLSHRKIAVIIDVALRNDVNNHANHEGIKPQAVSRPEEIDYENYLI
ncbi:hypothetical protein ACS5NO_24780 [Larkinella sp. GY13]|uniref:hypothetical protein n=1 Tax=Larkinella sp. GY13 TaxID=3453720 RepID=UPI003EEB3CB9